MSDDVLITPGSRKIEFKDSSANVDAKIETDSSGNLIITNTGGDITIGDTTSDIFVGDGTANVDIVFEQAGEIRGTTGVTVTLGAADSNIRMATDLNLNSNNITNVNDLTITGDLNITGDINSYNVTDLDVADKTITVGAGQTEANSGGSGLIVGGSGASLLWDEGDNYWAMNKSLAFDDTATTTNQALGIKWTGFDKEGTTDFSDSASIVHTVNTGGHSGSVLLIQSQNDSGDGIAFVTHASSYLKHNSSNILTAANALGQLGITSTAAELNKLDGYTGSVTELNYLDTLHATGVTSTEFDYLDGVTSNIQTQLDGKQASGSYLTSSSNLNASNISSGTINTARLPNPIHLSGGNAILKLQETDVTNSPTWWHVADGSNYSIRLNNTGAYPIQILTDSDNDAVTNIELNYTVDLGGNKLQLGSEATSYIQSTQAQGTDVFRFTTEDGYIQIGAENTSWAHFITDRPSFYFNTKVTVASHVEPYTDSSYNLGANTLRWSNVYADTLHGDGSNITGITATDSTKLPLAGGTMTGNINMNGNNLTAVNLIGFQNEELTTFTGAHQMVVDANDGDSNVPSHGDYAGSYPYGIYFTGDNDGSTTTLGSGLVKVWHTGHFKKAHIDYFVGLYDSGVTTTEYDYLDGVTSNIQTQLNAKLASSSYTASDVLTKIKTVDGSGSGLDADTLDGINSGSFLRSDANDTYTGTLDLAGVIKDNGDSRQIRLMHGTTNSQPAIGVGEQGTYGMKMRWNSGSNIEFDGFWNTSVTGSRNRDLGSINVNSAVWDFPTGVLINGSTAWHAGNDGSGSGLDADTVDGINSGSFLRSDADDTVTAGTTYTWAATNTEGLVFENSSYNKKLYIGGWSSTNSSGISRIRNSNDNLHLDSGSAGNLYLNHYSSGTVYARQNVVWHAGNDGSGSGLDADTLDGYQATALPYTPINDFNSLGTTAFTAGGGSNSTMTTAQYISEMEGDGAFDSFSSVFKTSWSYAGNDNLSDAGTFGPTETAGMSHLTWTDNSDDTTRGNITVLAIAPNTGGSAGGVYVYNDQGSSYAPGWREIWTSSTDGAGSGLDADLLDGQHGSHYLNYNNLTNTPTIPTNNNQLTNGAGYTTYTANQSLNTSNSPTFNQVITSNNGNGTNFRVGDDAWLGDTNVANTIQITGVQDSTQGYLVFGSSDNTQLGRSGTGALTYGGNTIWHAGNDGSGSGLDADTLDGINSGSFLRSDAADSASGTLSLNGRVNIGNSVSRPDALNSDSVTQARIGGSDVYLYVASLNSTGGYKVALQAARASDFASFTMNLQSNGGSLQRAGNTVWDAGTDGSGSGLDADVLDGLQASSFLRSDTNDTFGSTSSNQKIRFNCNSGQYIASGGSETRFPIEIFSPTANGGDAAISFHVSGDYAGYFGLASDWNDLAWGGWSVGSSTKYRIWHSGNDGSGSGLDADLLDGTHLSAIYSNSAVANTSVTKLYENSTITYGGSYLQWMDQSGTGGTGQNSANPGNPFNDWHHHIIMNHGNSNGYYVDQAFSFHSNRVHFRRLAGNNSPTSWYEFWHTGNDGSGSGLDADTLDGQQLSAIARLGHDNTGEVRATNFKALSGGVYYAYTSAGNLRGYMYATDTNDEHLILQTSGGEDIAFKDDSTSNMIVRGDGTVWVRDHLLLNTGDIKMADRSVLAESSGAVTIGDVSGNDEITTMDIKVYGGNGRVYLTDGEIFFNGTSNSTAGFKMIGTTGAFHSNGDVIAYSSTLTASDERLKENIEPLEGSLNKVLKLKGVKYDWKNKERGTNQIGLIAQEVEKVVPEVVNTIEDSLGDMEDMKVVNYSALVPVLVEALKQQQEQIDKLTRRINDIEEKGE